MFYYLKKKKTLIRGQRFKKEYKFRLITFMQFFIFWVLYGPKKMTFVVYREFFKSILEL
jgi:hypothetical protein